MSAAEDDVDVLFAAKNAIIRQGGDEKTEVALDIRIETNCLHVFSNRVTPRSSTAFAGESMASAVSSSARSARNWTRQMGQTPSPRCISDYFGASSGGTDLARPSWPR